MERMTRKKLSQAYHLDRELKMWEKKLQELREQSDVKSQSMDGMPKAGTISDVVYDRAVNIIEHIEVIEAYRINIEKKQKEIDMYITTLDDGFLRQIVQYRCCKLMTWDKVASMIGAGCSAESCRKYYERKIPAK